MKALLAVVLLASSARAATGELLVGPAFSTSKITFNAEDKAAANGLALGARFLGKAGKNLSAGLEVQSLNMGEATSNTMITNGVTTSKFSSLLFLVEAKLAAEEGAVRPFGILGFGFHSTALKIASTPRAGFAWANTATRETRSVVDSRKTSPAATLQGGIDVPVGERFAAGLSAAWYYLGSTTYDASSAIQQTSPGFGGIKGSLSSIALLASASYKF
ncbi:MAG: hypothetical protein M0D55_12365 [Elusimicrobiota bacterium]|nr:MAG: hypothetical protein M0D55_12365 [Elusimicrobiota bacterium]